MQFSNNAYNKPATGLNILRETIMGRELFDFAFKQYATRWMFKHPTPEDLFRTMEDASAVDLDWFWRGWFYSTDHVDISLDRVSEYLLASGNPADEKAWERKKAQEVPEELAVQRNRAAMISLVEADTSMRDFYDGFDPYKPDERDPARYDNYLKGLSAEERAWIDSGGYFYQLDFSNLGGLVMPLVLRFGFEDGQEEIIRIPAQIWSRNNLKTSKVFRFDSKVTSIVLDPFMETADCDMGNNYWPSRAEQNRFELFKRSSGWNPSNPMRDQ
jgi:hypothetical protein